MDLAHRCRNLSAKFFFFFEIYFPLTRCLGSSRCFDHLVMSDAFIGILRKKFALQIIRERQTENLEKEAAASLGFWKLIEEKFVFLAGSGKLEYQVVIRVVIFKVSGNSTGIKILPYIYIIEQRETQTLLKIYVAYISFCRTIQIWYWYLQSGNKYYLSIIQKLKKFFHRHVA